MADIREFFRAVACDHRDRAKNLLLELGGLGEIAERCDEFPVGDADLFLVQCDFLVNPKGEFAYVKWLFDCRKTPERDDRFIDWAISCQLEVFPTAEFLVFLGRVDTLKDRKEFTCPVQFLCDEDRTRIKLAESMAERLQIKLPEIQRDTFTGIDNDSPLSFESLTKRYAAPAVVDQQETAFVETMRRICARNTADFYMEVPLLERQEFNDQIIAALSSKHPREKIFHGLRGDYYLVRGFPPPDIDLSGRGELRVTFYVFREVPKSKRTRGYHQSRLPFGCQFEELK